MYLDHKKANILAYLGNISVALLVEEISIELSVKEKSFALRANFKAPCIGFWSVSIS